ncbi:MAG: RHS repeat-associated core domain-containing protein [Pseudomonadota bacterium]
MKLKSKLSDAANGQETSRSWRRTLTTLAGTLGLLAALSGFSAEAGQESEKGFVDILFADSFEGEGFTGGAISGQVLFDPDRDGSLSDGERRPGVTVYLDSNFNGRLDAGEPTNITDAEGFYRFVGLGAGIYHVRQLLAPPEFQTFPEGGLTPALDRLPDEVVEYIHSPAGVGDFDVPYGKTASEWPGEWERTAEGPLPRVLDSVDLVLRPIGVRPVVGSANIRRGTEFLSLATDAQITLRFDEPMIDGDGPDLLVYSLSRRTAGEMVEILAGPSPAEMTSLGLYSEDDNTISVDFASVGLEGPVNFIRAIGQDELGSIEGFELVGMEAINFADPDPYAHIVTIDAANRIYNGLNFGRFSQDLPPTLTIGLTDNESNTPELRAGESATIEVAAFDDLGVADLTLLVNGQPTTLDSDNLAIISLTNPGELLLEATVTDTANQAVTRSAGYIIFNSDGTNPNNPNVAGRSARDDPNAPRVRIVSPAPGISTSDDVSIIATITGDPSSWTLEYAPVDSVDPQNLSADDPDYLELATGSGDLFSETAGVVPVSTLPDGVYFVRLGAVNGAGQFAFFGQVVAKNVPEEDLRPLVVIDSPAAGDQISMTVDIVGTIASSRPLSEWYVEYARADTVDVNNLGSNIPDWRRIGSGNTTVDTPTVLANFDATLLRNNSYIVRIVVENDIGLGWVEPLALEVVGEAKLGRNRLEFTDIDINLAGFPLVITRVYDSLDAETQGDFGFGWSLKFQETDIGETVPDTGVLGLFGSTPFRIGTRVYLTAPTGERLGFTFGAVPGQPTLTGIPHRVQFEPDPGNYFQLEVPQGDQEFLRVRDDGSVYLFSIQLPYNPESYVLISPDGIRYSVHEDKGMLGAEDRNGNTLNFNPDGIQHSAGPALNFARDGQGRITAISDPDGNTWSYEYDGNGDLVSVTDPDMNITSYVYSVTNPHYLDTMMDPQGRMPRRFEYDPDSGRLLATIDENGQRREVNSDPQGFSGTITDRRGNMTYYEYDGRGNITLIEDAGGNTVTYQYEDPENPDRETRFVDASGEEWGYQYDSMGRPTRLTPPLANFSNNRFDIAYDEFGNITRFEGPDGSVDQFTYDDEGNRLSEEPAAGVSSTFEYGPSGQLRTQTTSPAFQIAYDHDANGFLKSQSNSSGYTVDFVNQNNGLPIERTDNNGRLDISYTPSGLLNTQQDQAGNTASLVENLDGSQTRTDRTGNTSQIFYDGERNPTEISLPESGMVQTSYDPDGNPNVVTDPLGNTTTYTFDYADRLTSVRDQLSNSESYGRDGNGNILENIDRNGKRRTFAYDANQRLTHERWHDMGGAVIREIVFTYDPGTGLERVDDTVGGETYTHEFRGRLPRIDHVDYILPGQESWRVRYTWSAEQESPTLVRVGINNNTQASIGAESFGGETLRLTWRNPDSSDNEVQIFRNPIGTIQRIQRLTGTNGGDAVSVSEFEYDSQSRVSVIRHLDDMNVLLHPNAELTYTRDDEGRVLSESHAGNTVSYIYDAKGQITAASHTDPSYADESYTFDVGGNRLTSHLAPSTATVAAPNRITVAGDYSYEYDDAGNLIRRTHSGSSVVDEYVYDHRNRLVQGTVHPSLGAPADQTVQFEYDFEDRLLFRVVNGQKTWVLHDREHRIAEFADSAAEISASFLYDPAEIDELYGVWRAGGSGERWFLKDHLGSVRGVADAAFNVLSWVDYDSYGNLQTGAAPANIEPIRYAARPFSEELGLYDNRRRFLDPMLGRFTQEDPIKHGGRDFNFYRYVLNSPTGFTDPAGTVAYAESNFLDTILFMVDYGKNNPEDPDDLAFPCHIAGWSASNFVYFDPLAELILDPRFATFPPDLDGADLKRLTGCNVSDD